MASLFSRSSRLMSRWLGRQFGDRIPRQCSYSPRGAAPTCAQKAAPERPRVRAATYVNENVGTSASLGGREGGGGCIGPRIRGGIFELRSSDTIIVGRGSSREESPPFRATSGGRERTELRWFTRKVNLDVGQHGEAGPKSV